MVSSQAPKWIATARVLRRMGFGTTGSAVDAVVNGDLTDHVKSALAADAAADPGAVATPMPQLSYPAKRPGKGADQAQRQRRTSSKRSAAFDLDCGDRLARDLHVEQR